MTKVTDITGIQTEKTMVSVNQVTHIKLTKINNNISFPTEGIAQYKIILWDTVFKQVEIGNQIKKLKNFKLTD